MKYMFCMTKLNLQNHQNKNFWGNDKFGTTIEIQKQDRIQKIWGKNNFKEFDNRYKYEL